MHESFRIGCVIPCYKGDDITLITIAEALEHVDLVVLVDDYCPNKTGARAEAQFHDEPRFRVLFNKQNCGVGKSTVIGFAFLIESGCDIVVKLDADGQMKPSLIADLITPVVQGHSDACKGNRFSSIDHIVLMPKIRIVGNLGLGFLSKLSTGYWELFDPTNGFLAFKSSALRRVRLDKLDDRYFFESDLLFQCGLAQITFSQLYMSSVYGQERSSLRPLREIRHFAHRHIVNFFKRIVYQYFLLDFNAGSLELIIGLFGILTLFGFTCWLLFAGVFYTRFATAGESSFFAITTIITIQMFVGFLYYDSTQMPLLRGSRRHYPKD